MKNIFTISDYCKEINIPPPKHVFFDVRRFEDNMATVNAKQSPFRHEFYAIALRYEGTNSEVMGKPLQASLFFNSPYQVITWDIKPDWKGWYIIFDRTFISQNANWQNFITDYPFFRLDKYIAFDLPLEVHKEAVHYFNQIFAEYHSDNQDKFQFISAYTQLLLSITKRHFQAINIETSFTENNRTGDVLLVSKFQTLIEMHFTKEVIEPSFRQSSFYAEKLNIHPNHLNAVVKRITEKTASQIIQQYLITFAKSLLKQTELSVKEISFRLHFSEPSHFNSFFKKHLALTPQQFRDKSLF